ncbi:MAG: PAS domain S-box protein [Candidatus Sericytochromatia bacterium]|nr:PAS domain S-box protein [Candidatus Tanganyikabacteria bacterium]
MIPGGPRSVALAAGVLVVLIGCVVLASWAAGPDWLTSLAVGQPRMMPLTATGLAIAGVGLAALALGGRAARWLVPIAAVLVGFVGLGVLLEYALALDLGIDRLLLYDQVRAREPYLPGRPSPQTATSFVLIALALLAADRQPKRTSRIADAACILAASIAYLAVLGYAAAAPQLNRISPAIGMALPTAVAFFLLAAGIVASRPDRGLAARLMSPLAGGVMLRRMLVAPLGFPLLMAFLRTRGEQAGLFDVQVGIAIMALGITVLGLALIAILSKRLDASEAAYRAEHSAALEDRQRVRTIVDTISDAVFLKDRAGRYVVANEAAARLLGRSVAEMVGRTDADLFAPDDAAFITRVDREMMASGRPYAGEELLRFPSQGARIFHSVKAPFVVDGEVRGLVGVARDITERKRVEAEIAASEARYRGLLEAAPDAVLVVDCAGVIRIASARATEIFGYSRDELLGQPIELLVPEEYRERHVSQRKGYVAGPHGRQMGPGMDLKGRRKDGSLVEIEIGLAPVETPEGRMITAFVRDVTERHALEAEKRRHEAEAEAARETARLKDTFLSSISHEIKTPLSMILGYAELLEDRSPDDPLVAGLIDGARRLIRHVDAILTYSALASGALPLYRTEVCLHEVIRDIACSLETELAAAGQTLDLDLGPGDACITGDARRIRQVIQGLVENASRFSPPATSIRVSVRQAEGGQIEVTVSDSGRGMSEAELARAWEPFEQAAAGVDRTGGLGLGLKIARKLVELHGGSISIFSAPGQGTRVTVLLPALPPVQPAARRPASERPAS